MKCKPIVASGLISHDSDKDIYYLDAFLPRVEILAYTKEDVKDLYLVKLEKMCDNVIENVKWIEGDDGSFKVIIDWSE